MPNWVRNIVYVRGDKTDLVQFLRDGHSNKKVDLNNLPAYSLRSWFPLPKTFKNYDTANKMWSFDTWCQKNIMPGIGYNTIVAPDVYDLFKKQYSNYKKGYANAVKYQVKKYNAVGWYNYNCFTLGCKWDCPFDSIEVLNGMLRIEFDSPWTNPYQWIISICNKYYDLEFISFYSEEANDFCGWSVNEEEMKCIERCSEDDIENIYDEFMNYVNS